MTTAIAFQPVDMAQLFATSGTITAASSNRIELSYTGGKLEFYGNFQYSLGGLSGGTVSRAVQSANGTQIYEVEGGPFEAVTLYELLAAGENTAMLDHLLAGADEIDGSSGNDALLGNTGNDHLRGHLGDDRLTGGAGNDWLDGGGGQDTAEYAEPQALYTVSRSGEGFSITARSGAEGVDLLQNIELVSFADATLDLTTLSQASHIEQTQLLSLAELYVAYFGRAPDAGGLFYWAGLMMQGVSLNEIAKSFFDQPETQLAFPAGQSGTAFVSAVYRNVLNREPDSEGLGWWTAALENGAMGRDNLIMAVIAAAHSETGSAIDAAILSNKAEAGLHFAATRGLNNADQLQLDLGTITETAASKVAAIEAIDHLYSAVLSGEQHDLIIQIVGVDTGSSPL